MHPPSPYTHLRFDAHVDWQHANPALWSKLNTLAASKHVVIDVFSGYRSNDYSAKVGGFRGDPHTKGIAADANVNGKPLGQVFSAQDFQRAGLVSGNQPNFYHGKPDPSHVQLGPGQALHDGTAPMVTGEQPAQAVPAATGSTLTASQQPDTRQVPAPDTGAYSPPTLMPPGSGPQARQVAEWWQQIASQPFAAPETQAWAGNATATLGG